MAWTCQLSLLTQQRTFMNRNFAIPQKKARMEVMVMKAT
ncbi:hypothetical protein FOIG_16812 [Fusarium odoratissimum NRRL 54006]|uniref:Uncharacterized protein n=1 Tax=Fusarium odoratissimum (strain NRRL 54006) TaxID=1089451 RepID=X0J0M9_FUSO5|nr:uncharacterized protein FOIG_16812 [Fusarium odoratissimum NRRL 54006]EXL89906.1 hypothetical protein FOIG_16812 [Fusarium odoratissimum NRRL 54006]